MEKIFYAHSVNVIGGAERVTLATIKGIRGDYEPILLAPEGKELGQAAMEAGASFEAIKAIQPEKSKPISSLRQLWEYYKLFKKYRPKFVHTGDLLALRSLQPICKLLKIPMICHVHFPYEKPFMQWALKNRYAPHTFIFCSKELKDNLHGSLSSLCPESSLIVIHNGVDTDKFKPEPSIKNIKPRIGIIANLQYRKGHDDFLEMASLLKKQGLDAQYDIIGGDILQEPREPYLKQKAQNLGLKDNVIFHGQLPDVKAELQKLDIVICASHEEAFPISILEAMACGKAIVSTNVNGIPEAIIDNETGYLVPSHHPDALAEKVLALINSHQTTLTFTNNARQRVVKNFSTQVYIDNLKQIYHGINNNRH